MAKSQQKIGIVGHFKLENGAFPDGIGTWCETMLRHLRSSSYDVAGYGYVGVPRDDDTGRVSITKAGEIADTMHNDGVKIALVRGGEPPIKGVLRATKDRGIKTIFVIPYWGVHKGVFELAQTTDILFTGTWKYVMSLIKKTGTDCRFAPWPIDVDFLTPGESNYVAEQLSALGDEPALNMAYAGRIGSNKRMHKFLEPLKRYLLDQGHNFRFFIAGPPEKDMGTRLEQEIERLGLEKNVLYAKGYVPRTIIREIYRSCDVFAFPTATETYGLSHLEALSCGTPMIAPQPKDYAHYALPSMENLPGYPLSFPSGTIWTPEQGRIHEPEHNWEVACNNLIWISQNLRLARTIASEWSVYIKNNMSPEVVVKTFERAIEDLN